MRQSMISYLSFDDADAAIAFYDKAFGMTSGEATRLPNGKIMNVALTFGNAELYLSDKMGPDSGSGAGDAIMLTTDDADALWARAVGAGCTPAMPLEDAFWGDRFGMVIDPFGRSWGICQPLKEPTAEEMSAGVRDAAAFMESGSTCGDGASPGV